MPGLCLLDIGSAPYIGYNIMPPKAYFHIFDFLFWKQSMFDMYDVKTMYHYRFLIYVPEGSYHIATNWAWKGDLFSQEYACLESLHVLW